MYTIKLINHVLLNTKFDLVILLLFTSLVCAAEGSLFHHYNEEAKQGDTTSKIILGMMYEKGITINKDIVMAEDLYDQAAKFGDSNGYAMLARLYSRSNNNDLALKLYRKVVESGDYKSFEKILALTMSNKTREQQFSAYLNSAKIGNPISLSTIGIMYEKGYGVPSDIEKAIYWYNKGAEAGLFGPQFNLGYLYHIGNGVEKDNEKALYWYNKAADNSAEVFMNTLNMAKFYLGH